MSTIQLYLGDCLEVMQSIPAASVDAVITDLPYGTSACVWDSIIPFGPMWKQVNRLLKRHGVFVTTASQPFTSALVMSNLASFKYGWIWHKNLVGCNWSNSKNAPIKYHEDILVFGNHVGTYNPQPTKRESIQSRQRMKTPVGKGTALRAHGTLRNIGNVQYDNEWKMPGSVLDIKCVPNAGGNKFHPTQKPVALYDYLIRTYTNEGDTVCDFCMGSGSVGVASVQAGRHFIGIEISDEYFAVAQRRIAEAQAQLRLPEPEAEACLR